MCESEKSKTLTTYLGPCIIIHRIPASQSYNAAHLMIRLARCYSLRDAGFREKRSDTEYWLVCSDAEESSFYERVLGIYDLVGSFSTYVGILFVKMVETTILPWCHFYVRRNPLCQNGRDYHFDVR